MEFDTKLLQEDGTFFLEKGKTCKGKPVGSWVGVRREGLKYPLRTRKPHASFDGFHGRCKVGVCCGSWPSSWRLHPSNIEIDLGMRSNRDTKNCISIILDLQGTIVLLVTPAAVELSLWIGLLGWGKPMAMRV